MRTVLIFSAMEQCNTYKPWHDNAFLKISNVETAQKLSDRINPEDLHKVLDVFARRYAPVAGSLGLSYTWTFQQIECATGIMFQQPQDLQLEILSLSVLLESEKCP